MGAKLKLTAGTAPPPAHLSESSKRLWAEVVAEFDVRDAPGLAVLQAGLEARGRAEEARKLLDKEGLTTSGDRGGIKAHPAVTIERDNRAAFVQAMKVLNFSPEPAPISRRR